MDPHRRGVTYGAAAYLCWGLLSPGNEILLRQVDPMWMQAIRAAAAFAIPALWFGRAHVRAAWRLMARPPLLAAFAAGTLLSFGLFIESQTRVDAAYTTLGFYTAPLWTALLGWSWMREGVGWSFVPAIAGLGLGGWLALTGGGMLPAPDSIGMALAVGSGLSWAIYAVLLRRHAGDADWRDLLIGSMLLGALGFTLLALLREPLPDVAAWSGETWTWTVIQILVPTLAAMALFQTALRKAPSAQVNILVALELAGTVFFAWLLLGFTFSGVQLGGVALCLVSVAGYLWWRSHNAAGQQAAHQQ